MPIRCLDHPQRAFVGKSEGGVVFLCVAAFLRHSLGTNCSSRCDWVQAVQTSLAERYQADNRIMKMLSHVHIILSLVLSLERVFVDARTAVLPFIAYPH